MIENHKRLSCVPLCKVEILRHWKLPQSQLSKACNFTFNHLTSLGEYLNRDQVATDNNAIERAIRPTAIGKKTGCSSATQRLETVRLSFAAIDEQLTPARWEKANLN